MEKKIVAILGASDPEMEMIESLLHECGVGTIYALNERGERVKPHEAYRAAIPDVGDAEEVWAVECLDVLPDGWIRIDHHRPGDPGHGLGPEDFLKASSIGQVIRRLAKLNRLPLGWHRLYAIDETMRTGCVASPTGWLSQDNRDAKETGPWYVAAAMYPSLAMDTRQWVEIPAEYVLCAAADHCLAHAYAGSCPGVTREDLLDWRIASKAKFQNRPEADIRREIAFSRDAIQKAPKIKMGHEQIADMRDLRVIETVTQYNGARVTRDVMFSKNVPLGTFPYGYDEEIITDKLPELPEGGTLEGIPYLAVGLGGPDGKTKVICQGASPETITYFMETWGPANGLTEIYGMPERGIAGGYLVKE